MTIEAQADGMTVNSDSGRQKTVARHRRETREMTVEAATKREAEMTVGVNKATSRRMTETVKMKGTELQEKKPGMAEAVNSKGWQMMVT